MTSELEPSLSLNQEETAMIGEGLQLLDDRRKKTVVFERLMMKLGKVEKYWKDIERARELKKQQLAQRMTGKSKNAK